MGAHKRVSNDLNTLGKSGIKSIHGFEKEPKFTYKPSEIGEWFAEQRTFGVSVYAHLPSLYRHGDFLVDRFL